MRVALEKVNGQYQGACFSFYHAEGLKAGICRLAFSSAGELIIGRAGEGNWARGKPDSGPAKNRLLGNYSFRNPPDRIAKRWVSFSFHPTG